MPAKQLAEEGMGGVVLQTLFDPLLSSYSVIMLDEAHERSMYVDRPPTRSSSSSSVMGRA